LIAGFDSRGQNNKEAQLSQRNRSMLYIIKFPPHEVQAEHYAMTISFSLFFVRMSIAWNAYTKRGFLKN